MPYNQMTTVEKVTESNRIEGINRPPTQEEVDEHDRFMTVGPKMTIDELKKFVKVYQPDAKLRDQTGLDVRVGNHTPPRGGAHIVEQLQALLDDINIGKVTPWEAHVQYETLHPFTDCNGRSGRAIWYWIMLGHPMSSLGFLHAFYYQTLQESR